STDRCTNSTEMLLSMQRTTLILVDVPSRHSCAISSARASEGRWYTIAPSSLQTMRGFVKYKHPQQLPRCPMRLPIEVFCPLAQTQRTAATPLQTGAFPSKLIRAHNNSSI